MEEKNDTCNHGITIVVNDELNCLLWIGLYYSWFSPFSSVQLYFGAYCWKLFLTTYSCGCFCFCKHLHFRLNTSHLFVRSHIDSGNIILKDDKDMNVKNKVSILHSFLLLSLYHIKKIWTCNRSINRVSIKRYGENMINWRACMQKLVMVAC